MGALHGRGREAQGRGTRVQGVTGKGSGTRRFLACSPERKRHERKLRRKQQDKVRARLEGLQKRVASGEFERAGERERQQLRKAGKKRKPRPAATRSSELAGRILARACKDLWRVERAFRSMKDVLDLRPAWH